MLDPTNTFSMGEEKVHWEARLVMILVQQVSGETTGMYEAISRYSYNFKVEVGLITNRGHYDTTSSPSRCSLLPAVLSTSWGTRSLSDLL